MLRILRDTASSAKAIAIRCFTECLRYSVCMKKIEPQRRTEPNPGLCVDCVHARRLKSDRGSTFILCELSSRDPRYPRYPSLPVLSCDGYKRKSE